MQRYIFWQSLFEDIKNVALIKVFPSVVVSENHSVWCILIKDNISTSLGSADKDFKIKHLASVGTEHFLQLKANRGYFNYEHTTQTAD